MMNKTGQKHCRKGFTLAELLVALAVSSIILSAVAALAFALSSANDTSNDTSLKQAQLRYTTLRISDLVRNCKLVCLTSTRTIAIWQADDSADGQINVDELIYIDSGPGADHIRIYESRDGFNQTVDLSDIPAVGQGWWNGRFDAQQYVAIIPQCSKVQFSVDSAAPDTGFVSVSFDLEENGTVSHYEVSAALRSRAEYLLSSDATSIVSDDD